MCQLETPVEQHLEEQVFARAVGLDAVRVEVEFVLLECVRSAQDVSHVGRVHLEDAKANVEVASS